jgi:hypothetical protein
MEQVLMMSYDIDMVEFYSLNMGERIAAYGMIERVPPWSSTRKELAIEEKNLRTVREWINEKEEYETAEEDIGIQLRG